MVPGDGLRFGDPLGRWYGLAAGDHLALSVLHSGEVRGIEVTVPAAAALPRYRVANYLLGTAQALVALLLGVVVGWRRSDLVAYRALAAAGLMNAFIFPYWAPAAFHVGWLDFVASVSQELGPAMLVFFALNYPDDKPVGLRATFRRYYPWLFALLLALFALWVNVDAWFLLGPLLTALFWLGLALFSSVYFSSAIISEHQLYGTIGVIFVLLTWFIAMGAALVLGAACGAEWQARRETDDHHAEPVKAVGLEE